MNVCRPHTIEYKHLLTVKTFAVVMTLLTLVVMKAMIKPKQFWDRREFKVQIEKNNNLLLK